MPLQKSSNEVTEKAVGILLRWSMKKMSNEERYIDVSKRAKRIDVDKRGSIKRIGAKNRGRAAANANSRFRR